MNILPIQVLYQGWQQFFLEELTIINSWFLFVSAMCIILDAFTLQRALFILMAIILFRKIVAGGFCCNGIRLNGKTVVITGANTGIGKETAIELADRGATIILACRDMKKAEAAASQIHLETGSRVTPMKLDLSSIESIKSFANQISKNYSQVDILINNAGVMMCPYGETKDGFEMQMGVNHFGHFLLTNLLLPLLRKSPDARIINVSSMGHRMGKIPFDDFNYQKHKYSSAIAYGSSKLANILHARQLGKVLQGSNIQVFALHPGCVQSDLGRHLPLFFGFVYSKLLSFVAKTTREGAQTTIYCATEAVQQPTFYFCDCLPANPSNSALSDNIAERLWQVSEKMLNLS